MARLGLVSLAALSFSVSACTGTPNPLPPSGRQLFEGPVVEPLALSADGQTLVRVNPYQNSITVFDVANPSGAFDVPVGVEPVSVAFRPQGGASDPKLVFVANHISDSISVVDLGLRNVVQTVQAFDADGVSTTNEPTGIAFAGPNRAFATLDQPNEVVALEPDAQGNWAVRDPRLKITAQGPRALAVSGSQLYVAAFESGNRSVTASCGPGVTFPCDNTLAPERRVLPIVRDVNAPDRDLFVFDVSKLDLSNPPVQADGYLHADQVVESVGTLLYGVAVGPQGRIYITNTDAHNLENGDVLLSNRMFDNIVSRVDCTPTCGPIAQRYDLDASAGRPVPTPYGVAVSADGSTVAVTAAGAEAGPLIVRAQYMPGLFLFSATGALLGQAVVGSLPQGVVLRSDPITGAARTAYVWNSFDGSVSVVDVSNPASPSVTQTLSAPVPQIQSSIRAGRLLFRSARASTSNTFSCESCHPNGHIDQLIWVLNAPGMPTLGAVVGAAGPQGDPESRVTLSVRGLRDTLPLHWDGSLAKPTTPPPGVQPVAESCTFDVSAPDLGDLDCFRNLVDTGLAGVMCDQHMGACPMTESLPGELAGLERSFLAEYVAAVAPHPGPSRRPGDDLSDDALLGVTDLIDIDGNAGGCTRTGAGCHEFPLGNAPELATGFAGEAGPFRTMWDRFNHGSNGGGSSHAHLLRFQSDTGYDPALGPSELASFKSFVANNFLLPSFVSEPMFEFLVEQSAGYSGLLGRQLTISPAMVATPSARATMLAQVQGFERAAAEGRINAVGRVNMLLGGAMRQLDGAYKPEDGFWELTEETSTLYSTDQLLAILAGAAANSRVTIRADLPSNVTLPASGLAIASERQPLLRYDNPTGRAFLTPQSSVLRVSSWYVTSPSTAAIYVDGVQCTGCSIAVTGPLGASDPHDTSVTLNPMPASGAHVVQVQNQRGWFSNELIFKVP